MSATSLIEAKVSDIYFDEGFNTRVHKITPESVQTLAETIGRYGWISPVELIPMEEVPNPVDGFKYHLRSGHRRVGACILLGRETVPAIVTTGLDMDTALKLNFIENMERKDLTLVEEARALQAIYPSTMKPEEIAKDIRRSIHWVGSRLKLLTLSPWIIERFDRGEFNEADLRMILKAKDKKYDAVAKKIAAARKDGTYRKLDVRHKGPPKSEVNKLAKDLLADGFSPHLVRLLTWTTGGISDEELKKSLAWLHERRGWLR